nr:armadillo repeat-containing protein 7 [Tanacetum cinerariifolium]
EFETFCFDVEEISSGSTTTRYDISLPEYEVFYDDQVKKISSDSTTTHSDSSLYDSFIFDLSINPFPPTDRSDFYEFADELIHIISPPKYDCFFFKIEPNSENFTMDVVEDISLTREPRASGSNVTFLILYVDDIIIMGNHIPSLQSVKDYLVKCFAMKDLGKAIFIVGIKIYKDRSKRLIRLGQNAYTKNILEKYKMDNSKRGHIPMQERLDLNKTQGASTSKEVKHYHMFTKNQRQDERTEKYGTPRLQYLQELVAQFQNASTEASKEKVAANLANFAYDPFNHTFIRQLHDLTLSRRSANGTLYHQRYRWINSLTVHCKMGEVIAADVMVAEHFRHVILESGGYLTRMMNLKFLFFGYAISRCLGVPLMDLVSSEIPLDQLYVDSQLILNVTCREIEGVIYVVFQMRRLFLGQFQNINYTYHYLIGAPQQGWKLRVHYLEDKNNLSPVI